MVPLRNTCQLKIVQNSLVRASESFEIFIDLYKPFTTYLELVGSGTPDEWNRETCADAHSVIGEWERANLVVQLATKFLFICLYVAGVTHAVNVSRVVYIYATDLQYFRTTCSYT